MVESASHLIQETKWTPFLALLASGSYGLEPDYSHGKTVNSVFIDAAGSIMRNERQLNIFMDTIASPVMDRDLASCVPDWVRGQDRQHMRFLRGIGMPEGFRATNHPRPTFWIHDEASLAPRRVLELKGMRVDVLDQDLSDESRSCWRWYACRPDGGRQMINVATKSIAQLGDEVWIIGGLRWPFTVRRLGVYRCLISPAMLHEQAVALANPQHGMVSSITYGSLDMPRTMCMYEGSPWSDDRKYLSQAFRA